MGTTSNPVVRVGKSSTKTSSGSSKPAMPASMLAASVAAYPALSAGKAEVAHRTGVVGDDEEVTLERMLGTYRTHSQTVLADAKTMTPPWEQEDCESENDTTCSPVALSHLGKASINADGPPPMLVVFANSELFSTPSGMRKLAMADGVCIDMDAQVKSGRTLDAVQWIDRGLQAGKQMFAVGSLETLMEVTEWTNDRQVALVARTGSLAHVTGENLAKALTKRIHAMGVSVRCDEHPATSKPAILVDEQPIDSRYYRDVLTDKQDRELTAMLNRS